jgi:two-component system chemotaxis sensor kinase CheA
MSIAIEGMEDIIKEFLVESTEGLDLLDRDLIALERDPGSAELLSEIFRAAHTIKGTSGVLGFPKLESVAHVGENLLSRLRDGKLALHPALTNALLAMVDALRQMLAEIERTGIEGDGDYRPVVRRLEQLLEKPAASKAGPTLPVAPAISVPITTNAAAAEGAQLPEAELLPPSSPGITIAAATRTSAAPAARAENKDGQGVSGSNIRVNVGLLDKMMNLAGELVLARNQLLQFTSGQGDAILLNAAQHLNRITTELQEGVMKTRMQPIGNVWNKVPRLVRDMAMQFGKQVEIEMEGSETELDKTIIEAIKDPLTHILRNSIDHGIEPPAQRCQAGKPASGLLKIRAFHEGGQVNIEISDDGSGINLERVRQRAIDRGLLTPEQAIRMGDRELANLVFLPGFSTAEKITNVSGRGVGMDVVKTNIEKIGGTVDLQSLAGQGTTLKIKIPLTLAIIAALIVTSGGERFAIPQVSLLELLRLDGSTRIEHIYGAPVYRLRGRLLPLVFLNRELHLQPDGSDRQPEAVNIVVLRVEDRQFGLVVDAVSDTEEIVVKPLAKQLKAVACFAGATIMGDGQVALILDVLRIAQMARVLTEPQKGAEKEAGEQHTQPDQRRQSWLLFCTSGGRHMALPLAAVARLEEFAATRIESSGDGEVVQYRGEIMPLIRISKLLNEAVEPRDYLPVVVCSRDGHSVGLVVDRIEDIDDETVEVPSERGSGFIVGSAVIQQRVTDLVDMSCVIAIAGQGADDFVVAGRS